MTLVVKALQAGDVARWDAFVDRHPDATFFHRAGWQRVLEQAFGHRTHFLFAEEDGAVRGVLPLAEVKSRLFGHSLVSLPFCVYGGIVAETAAAAVALREAACARAHALQVGALELRNLQSSETGWPSKDLYATFRRPLDPDPDVNMKAIPNKQRAMVRKGINNALGAEEDSGTARLYRVYSESVRNLGTPVFAERYLQTLREVFGEACRVLMIQHGGRDIAGVLSFYFRDQVLPYYGGSIAAARDIKGSNDYMYWELMRRSCLEGLRAFDFGRSKVGTGPYSFKKNWGFTPEPMAYEYFLVRAQQMPDVNPLNPKYQRMIRIWQKLPLPVANTLGPLVARSLG